MEDETFDPSSVAPEQVAVMPIVTISGVQYYLNDVSGSNIRVKVTGFGQSGSGVNAICRVMSFYYPVRGEKHTDVIKEQYSQNVLFYGTLSNPIPELHEVNGTYTYHMVNSILWTAQAGNGSKLTDWTLSTRSDQRVSEGEPSNATDRSAS